MTANKTPGYRLWHFTLWLFAGLAVTIALVAALPGYILLTYDDEDYRKLLIRTVERFSDSSLSIDGPFHLELSSTPGISVTDIRLVSANGDYDISIGNLQTRIELRPLLSNFLVVRYFYASHADIRLKEVSDDGDKTPASDRRATGAFITPVIHDVKLDDILLSYQRHADPEPVPVKLDRFDIREISNGTPLQLHAAGSVSGTGFTLFGTLGDIQGLLESSEPYPLHIDLKLPQTSLSVDGVIGNPHEGTGLDLAIDGKAPALERILGLVHLRPPPLGALSFTTRLEGHVTAPEVTDLDLALTGKNLSFTINGDIGDPVKLQGLDLRGSLDVGDAAILKWLLPAELPPLATARLSAEVTSKEADYLLTNLATAVTGPKGLAVSLDGTARISRSDQPLQEIDAKLSYSARDTSAIRHFSTDVPLLGPVSLSARLAGSGQQLEVSKLQLRAGDEKSLYLRVKGNLAIDNLMGMPALGPLDVWAMLSTTSTAALSAVTGTEVPELGRLDVSAVLQNTSGYPGLKELNLRLYRNREMTLIAKGSINRLDTLGDMDINIDLLATSLAALGRPFSIALPDEGRVKLQARITGHLEDFNLKGEIKLLRTRIQADIQTLLSGVRPKFSGTLGTHLLQVSDLGLHPSGQSGAPQPEAETSPPKAKTGLFSSEPFELDALKLADADLKLAIDRIQGTEKLFDNLQAHITLDNGLLEIRPLTMDYEGGRVETHLTVNSRTQPARTAVKIESSGLRMGTLLAQKSGETVPLRGYLSTDIDVSSEGRSEAALAANLSGKINIMSENARVRKHYVELLAKDVLGWALSNIVEPGKMVNIDCMLFIAQAEQGEIRTKTFLLDSAISEIRVDATVNLGNQSIDAIIYPKRKGRLWNSAKPIEVSGPLSDPTVKATSVAEISTKAAKTALLAPVLVTRELLGGITGAGAGRRTNGKGGCSKFLANTGK